MKGRVCFEGKLTEEAFNVCGIWGRVLRDELARPQKQAGTQLQRKKEEARLGAGGEKGVDWFR